MVIMEVPWAFPEACQQPKDVALLPTPRRLLEKGGGPWYRFFTVEYMHQY